MINQQALRQGGCDEFHWRRVLAHRRYSARVTAEIPVTFSKIRGTSLLKQAALLDYLEAAFILHSLVLIILTQANYSFHFLSNLELQCGKYLSWYC